MINSFPAVNGETVTERHTLTCESRGHATHLVDGKDTGVCPRCGAVKDEPVKTLEKVVVTRSTKKLAEDYIDRYSDALGEVNHWTGREFVPVLLTWTVVRNPDGKRWDVQSTRVAR